MKFNHQLACTRVVCSDVVTFKSNIFKTTFFKKKKIGTQIPFTSAHQFTWTVLHDANFTSCTKNTAAFHTNTCIMLTSCNHGCFSHEHLHDANLTSCKHGWFSHEHLPDANLTSCKQGWFSHKHHTLSSPIQSEIHIHTRPPHPKLSEAVQIYHAQKGELGLFCVSAENSCIRFVLSNVGLTFQIRSVIKTGRYQGAKFSGSCHQLNSSLKCIICIATEKS